MEQQQRDNYETKVLKALQEKNLHRTNLQLVNYEVKRRKAENEAISMGCELKNYEVYKISCVNELIIIFLGTVLVCVLYLIIGIGIGGGFL